MASRPTSAGPVVKLTSSTMPSSESIEDVNSVSPSASRTQRLRDSGPTGGTERPISAAGAICQGSGSPASEAVTRATIATALTAAATSPTVRCPRRSASRPTSGPPTACPTASAPATTEPRQTLSVFRVTSSSVPIGHIAFGSRPSSDQSSTPPPVSRAAERNLVTTDIPLSPHTEPGGRPPPTTGPAW